MPPGSRLLPGLLLVSLLLRLALIAYSIYHDAHSDIKYTDIDYNVFSDASHFLIHPSSNSTLANGPWTEWMGWKLGSPYERRTYRYTPLLAVLMLPNEWLHPAWGKLLFAASDLVIGGMLYGMLVRRSISQRTASLLVGGLWLFNPMVFSISTRGSSEAVLGLMVIASLKAADERRWDVAAVWLGLAAHWKLYPVVYGAAIWSALTGAPGVRSIGRGYLSVNTSQVRFGAVAVGTLGALSLAIWGEPFLEHTYLYHLHRRDHRHNFSPYFYPIYLAFSSSDPLHQSTTSVVALIARNPLASFVPQVGLTLGLGFTFGKKDLAFAWFLQTFAFASFNKVATSQYFLWYLWFLPLVIPRLRLSWRSAILVTAAWALGQALWLSQAYRLEFLGEPVFREVWAASIVFLGANAWVMGRLIGAYQVSDGVVAGEKDWSCKDCIDCGSPRKIAQNMAST